MPITVTAASTQQNQGLAALVGDINAQLAATSLSGQVQAVVNGSDIELKDIGLYVSQFSIQISDPTNPAATELGFTTGQTSKSLPQFSSIQTLIPLLASTMGISATSVNPQFNPATQSLTLTLNYQDRFQQTLPLTFGANAAPLTFDGAANASVTATATLNGTFGIDLGGLQTVLTGTAAVLGKGQLSADAHFSFSIGGGAAEYDGHGGRNAEQPERQ